MTKQANKGRGGKKNSKLLVREDAVVLQDASLSLDCGAELSEADENCDSLNCEGVVSDLEVQRVAGSVSAVEATTNGVDAISVHPEKEILEKFDVLEDKEEPAFVVPVEKRSIAQDWRQLFRSEKSLGALQYFAPTCEDGKVVVKPPREAIEEGISKWLSSLVGQFLDKPLPFYIVKRIVDALWAQYGKVEVFLLENGLYLFRFANGKIRDEVMEAKLWHIANKPLILRKWTPGMQLLKISLSIVLIWIKLHNLPIEF